MRNTLLRFATLLICAVLVLGVFSVPRNAKAQATGAFVPVFDAPNYASNSLTAKNTTSMDLKETVLDGIAWNIANVALQQMTRSIVNWINSGFDGNPAFVSDPKQFLLDVGDQVAGNIIAGSDLNFLCSPFALDIRSSLAFNYSAQFKDTISCTLTDVIDNLQGFLSGDWSQGGWSGWSALTQNQANNPYGSYILAQNEIAIRTAEGQSIEIAKLNWGDGFLSWTTCDDEASANQYSGAGVSASDFGTGTGSGDNSLTNFAQSATNNGSGGGGSACQNPKINTPGSVIQTQLNQAVGSGMSRLNVADSFNEIISALMAQLAQQVLGGGGLSGVSKAGSGGRGVSYIDNYANSKIKQQSISDYTNIDSLNGPASNIAATLGTASQSSTYQDFNASRALDNNTSGEAVSTNSVGSVAVTQKEKNPWWQVDLGSTQPLSNIEIYSQTKLNRVAIKSTISVGQYRVFVSNTAFDGAFDPQSPASGVWATETRIMPTSGFDSLSLNTTGRYVRIERVDGNNILGLAEVKIYKNNPPVITLNGLSTITITIDPNLGHALYEEQGAVATDERDGQVDVSINASGLNTFVPGTYTVKYTAVDSGGSASLIDRTVIVEEQQQY